MVCMGGRTCRGLFALLLLVPLVTHALEFQTSSYTSSVTTPGVRSTQTVQFTTRTEVPDGGQITLQFPADEGWSMPTTSTALIDGDAVESAVGG